jgi:hypothetical protein
MEILEEYCYTYKHMRVTRLVAVAAIAILLSLVCVASTKAKAAAGNLSQSYKSSTHIAPGSLVSLKSAHSNFVTVTNLDNDDQLIGVAVAPNNSLLAVDTQKNQIQVALSGVVPVLVSTLNGPIANGDHIAVSAISGVGMKAVPGSRVIGVAQASFDKHSSGSTTRQVQGPHGHTTKVKVGYVSVAIAIGSVAKPGNSHTQLLGLRTTASSVVGHQVSTISVVVSAIIALVALVALASLVFGTIRGSLVSIGRNPLAKPAIFQSLAQVMAMALLIMILAVVTIYLTLR